MAKIPHDRKDADLAPREMEILKSVIREHVLTGEPVGSRTLSRERGLDLSPATIRNIMSDLEERGFLAQPHASAGRLPTDRAWRLYVDRLMPPERISADHLHAIDEALVRALGEIPELLAEACRQLSRFSSQVGVVLAPELRRIVIEHLEFVRLEGPRIVAILVDRSGVVHNRLLEVAEPLEQRELVRIGGELSAQFAGMTLPAMRDAMSRRIAEASGSRRNPRQDGSPGPLGCARNRGLPGKPSEMASERSSAAGRADREDQKRLERRGHPGKRDHQYRVLVQSGLSRFPAPHLPDLVLFRHPRVCLPNGPGSQSGGSRQARGLRHGRRGFSLRPRGTGHGGPIRNQPGDDRLQRSGLRLHQERPAEELSGENRGNGSQKPRLREAGGSFRG